jgi:anti-anti-sigma regulatory factor
MGTPAIHIDLSELRYSDLAGLQAILRLTPLIRQTAGHRARVGF